jgi:hypothetical protein
MTDLTDPLTSWQKAIRDVTSAATSVAGGSAGVAGDLLGTLAHQGDLLAQVIQRQLEFERELVSRIGAPLRASLDLVDHANSTFHEQATSFRAASKTFAQLADLMDQQANLLERATAAIRDPASALKSLRDHTPGHERDPDR